MRILTVISFLIPAILSAQVATLTPGSGPNWTQLSAPILVGESGDVGYDKNSIVIGRWETPQFQTYSESFRISLVAFHVSGIEHGDEGIDFVRFVANDGTPVDVQEPAFDPQSGYWSWHVDLQPLATDGPVEVRAYAYPHAGRVRLFRSEYKTAVGTDEDLPGSNNSLVLFSNSNGTYDGSEYWVSNSGNDTTGDGSEEAPWATIEEVLDNNPDLHHCTIYLEAGHYEMPRALTSGLWAEQGWLTIKPASGVTRDQVFIDGADSSSQPTRILLLKMEDLTFDWADFNTRAPIGGISSSIKPVVWFSGVNFIGGDFESTVFADTGSDGFIIDNRSSVSMAYITASASNRTSLSNFFSCPRFFKNVSGMDVSIVANDIFDSLYLRDVYVTDTRYTTGAHSDLWQGSSVGANAVWLDSKIPNVYSQILFFDGSSISSDNTNKAVINVAGDYDLEDGQATLKSQMSGLKNVLIWHVSLEQTFVFNSWSSSDLGAEESEDFSFRANIIQRMQFSSNSSGFTESDVENVSTFYPEYNHFEETDWTFGTNTVTGQVSYADDTMLLTGYQETAPRTVRWDVDQNARALVTSRGPYEYQSGGEANPLPQRMRGKGQRMLLMGAIGGIVE